MKMIVLPFTKENMTGRPARPKNLVELEAGHDLVIAIETEAHLQSQKGKKIPDEGTAIIGREPTINQHTRCLNTGQTTDGGQGQKTRTGINVASLKIHMKKEKGNAGWPHQK